MIGQDVCELSIAESESFWVSFVGVWSRRVVLVFGFIKVWNRSDETSNCPLNFAAILHIGCCEPPQRYYLPRNHQHRCPVYGESLVREHVGTPLNRKEIVAWFMCQNGVHMAIGHPKAGYSA
jgi:hypothetical protein